LINYPKEYIYSSRWSNQRAILSEAEDMNGTEHWETKREGSIDWYIIYHTWKRMLVWLLSVYFLLYSSLIYMKSFLFITIDSWLNGMIMKVIDIEIRVILPILLIRKSREYKQWMTILSRIVIEMNDSIFIWIRKDLVS